MIFSQLHFLLIKQIDYTNNDSLNNKYEDNYPDFLALFIITCINLYFTKDVQILIIGLFFYIHGILEMTDPLTVYLMGVNHEDSK